MSEHINQPTLSVENTSDTGNRPEACGNDCTSGCQPGLDSENLRALQGIRKNYFDKVKLLRLFSGVTLLAVAYFVFHQQTLSLVLYLSAYFILGYDVVIKAIKNVFGRKLMAEHFLMTLATAGAFLIGEYPEAVAVMLFYQTGEYFQSIAVDHSKRSISALQQLQPDQARLMQGETVKIIDPADIKAGDLLLLLPGDRVPADGHVVEGSSDMDTAAMTGESMPKSVFTGDVLQAGFINGSGRLIYTADKPAADSAVSRILEIVQSSAAKKAPAERFISRFASVYTPVVVGLALAIAFVIPTILGQPFSDWIYRALILLVISCPCALVLSVPLSYFAGLGRASRSGLLVKGGSYLEKMAATDMLIFDKTGTLTSGQFTVSQIVSGGWSEEKILQTAATLEKNSSHPLARSIVQTWQTKSNSTDLLPDVNQLRDIPGMGLTAEIEGVKVMLGNQRLLNTHQIEIPDENPDLNVHGSVLHLAAAGDYKGKIIMSDQIRPEAADSLNKLKKSGIKQFVLMSGDHLPIVKNIAHTLNIDHAFGEMMPDEKVKQFEKLKKEHTVTYLGDGMNDAPVLAIADVGIAMGNGSDAAIQNADAVLISGRLDKLPELFSAARKTTMIVRQNIFIAISLKVLIMALAIFGLSGIWQAIFADVGVSLLAVLNTLRVLRVPGTKTEADKSNALQ